MADLYLALHLPIELYLGVTRTFEISLYEKATGGDTVLGRPTEALSKGAAENWSEYPFLVAGIGPASGAAGPLQLPCTWLTTNPAVITLVVPKLTLAAAVALATQPDPRLHFAIAGRRNTGANETDGVQLVKGPVTVYENPIGLEWEPLDP